MEGVTHKICPRCKTDKDASEYYIRKGRKEKRLSGFCKRCLSENRVERGREYKSKCVEYKGGCCEKCGYKKSNSALEFHHVDPSQKDFGIGGQRRTKFDDITKLELDKCLLLCANCHREEHERMHL